MRRMYLKGEFKPWPGGIFFKFSNTKFENFFKDEKEFPIPIDRSVFSKGAIITD